ncbi:MAG: O-antigen ligase family protein [Anaerolineaceae bacterium]|nr:O-antigen ligase family protein [Anaerolineaceae bacterium]MCB9101742.1 O-antigen ligase family protein [Anaerolineales bacterium]
MQRTLRWGLILIFVFILSTLAGGYFGWQIRRSQPPQPANFLAADKDYGVTVDLTQYDDGTLNQTLDAMHAGGLVWLRQPISWAELEPEPGQFNWQPFDRIIDAVNTFNQQTNQQSTQPTNNPPNFQLIAVLQDTPPWARPANTPVTTPPTELSDFGAFARAFAAHYGGRIDHYQIWDQPNLSAFWGDTFVDAAAYADLLREATLNIRTVDPEAIILTAALAATLEDGPLNLNELAYLDQLYRVNANRWFDVVAIQPFGLWTKPLDAPAPDQLNFRRAELLRQIMLNHGDGDTPIWATGFGWVALPADWSGQPSPWSNDLPSVQAPRTAAAIDHARRHWPWLGPMLAARWDTVGLATDDPARGFALTETPEILAVIETAARTSAPPGRYPATHPSGHFSPGWRFAATLADIPPEQPRTLTIPFEGTRLDLTVNRGDFRGHLWVTIDGQPANALPQDSQGRSYLILSDPLYEQAAVTLAHYLPEGHHEAVIEAEGGWEQWAVAGWTVANEVDTRAWQTGLTVAGLTAIVSGWGIVWLLFGLWPQIVKQAWAWSEIGIAFYNILGERGQLLLTFGLAAVIFLAQGIIALVLLPLLTLLILLRPDLGLALVTLAIFLFEIPLRLPIGAFSPVELTLALTLLGFTFRLLLTLGRSRYSSEPATDQPKAKTKAKSPHLETTTPQSPISNLQSPISNLQPPIINYQLSIINCLTDLLALTLVILAFLATLAADNLAVSLREWRVVVVESVIFYFLVRQGLDFGPNPTPKRWVWRLIDVFVAGAVLQAVVALYFYFFTDQTIDAEGVRRALGLAGGSPNNLALILGRAWPLLLAVAVLSPASRRRWLYGLALLPISLALYLTFSKGALLLGLPLSLVVMTLLYGLRHRGRAWRRVAAALGLGLTLFVLALIPFSQTERFRATFDLGDGSTGFFRLKLWQSSWAMLQDHWLIGIGLDNFLYQYRTRYILPEAWQEPDLNHPHNLILDFGTRLGIGGILLLIGLQVAFWRNAWRLFRQQADPLVLGVMGSMAVFLGHGLVDNSYFLVDLAFAFFLIIGIIQRLAEQMEMRR